MLESITNKIRNKFFDFILMSRALAIFTAAYATALMVKLCSKILAVYEF